MKRKEETHNFHSATKLYNYRDKFNLQVFILRMIIPILNGNEKIIESFQSHNFFQITHVTLYLGTS